jgi:branched-chain amino acid transport system ATP-binding protein
MDQDISSVAAHRRPEKGISVVLEGRRVFRSRSVMENLVIAAPTGVVSRKDVRARVERLLDEVPILGGIRNRMAGSLSGGQQQIVAVGQALMTDPKIIIFDEPSAGLAPLIVDHVMGMIQKFCQEGRSVMLVEQAVDHALPVADHVTIMDNGNVALAGTPDEIGSMDTLRKAYLGG